VGGLLNVTCGNAPELIIAILALQRGLHEVVKASVVGSIVSNVLLVLGVSMVVGGRGRQKQTFSRTASQAQASMLMLALVALVMPAIYELVHGHGLPRVNAGLIDFGSNLRWLSAAVACVLLASYAAGLVFSLRTHRQVFNPYTDSSSADWPVRKSVGYLAVSGIVVAIISEVLVGSISEAARGLGLSQFFIGISLVAIVGNAAEHWVAAAVAAKDKMDLSLNIAIGSAAQVALFVMPVLVLLSFVVGPQPLTLVFNGYEIGGLLSAVLVASFVTQEGESTWFEGVQLLSVYAVITLVFAFA
jgi:Ca2+:H+ antiporter